jgi:membrane protein implicated in regulation of membrane protease activity
MKSIVVGQFSIGMPILLFLVLVMVAVSAALIISFVRKRRKKTKKINSQMHHLSLNPSKTTEELEAAGK